MREYSIDWIQGNGYASVSAPSASALKNQILRLKEKYPDEVTIINANKDGSIFAHVPISYIRVSHPRQLTEEQRTAAAARLKAYWQAKRETE